MLEKTIEIGLLFDYYGRLLTDRQQEIMRLYYYQDFSLGEIAEELGISRQGVYDHIHRGEALLRDYEDKLKLVAKYHKLKNELNEINQFIVDRLPEKKQYKKQLLGKINTLKKYL